MHFPSKKIFLAVVALFMVLPLGARAAVMSLQGEPSVIGEGNLTEVTLSITSATPLNTFSGELLYPKALFSVEGVSNGNSIVSVWLTDPSLSSSTDGSISFTGFTPGGFSGTNGKLFSVILRSVALGTGSISLSNIQVLRNDGVGTAEPTTAPPLSLTVNSQSQGGYTEPVYTAAPEPFEIYLASNQALFNGGAYLTFSAVDKGSGIDHYEVAESRWPLWLVPLSWSVAQSPYLIHDQYLTSTIYIKAVDRNQHETISVFPRQHWLRPQEEWILGAILLLVIAGVWYANMRRGAKALS